MNKTLAIDYRLIAKILVLSWIAAGWCIADNIISQSDKSISNSAPPTPRKPTLVPSPLPGVTPDNTTIQSSGPGAAEMVNTGLNYENGWGVYEHLRTTGEVCDRLLESGLFQENIRQLSKLIFVLNVHDPKRFFCHQFHKS